MNTNQSAQWGTTILRLVIAAIFIAHGGQKLFGFGIAGTAGFFAQIGIPLASVAAPLVIGLELPGGIAIALGLFTRWTAIPLAITMVVGIATVHLSAGFFLPNGYEFALALLGASAFLALNGAGAYSVDGVIARRRGDAADARRGSVATRRAA